MKTIYCIALEGNGPTGVDWFFVKKARDEALGTTGADEEIAFSIEVPNKASRDKITDLADRAAWEKSYLKSTRGKEKS